MPDQKSKDDKEWLTIEEAFPNLKDAAMEAEALDPYDYDYGLEEYAKEWRGTEQGKAWLAFVATLEWKIIPGTEKINESNSTS